jgi:hypothetical protein
MLRGCGEHTATPRGLLLALLLLVGCIGEASEVGGGDEEGGAGQVHERQRQDPAIVEIGGQMFFIFSDVSASPHFSRVSALAEHDWHRPPLRATKEDCESLHSSSAPVVLNTHGRLHKAGQMHHLPYLFREHCLSRSAAAPGELLVTASARNVWVMKHGAMAYKAKEGWTLVVPHVEYHGVAQGGWPPDAGKEMGEKDVGYAEVAINVAQAYAHNYYHFMAEVIPRLMAVPEKILHDPRARVLMPSNSKSPFMSAMLKIVGVDPSRAITHHAEGGLVFASRVYVPVFAPYRWHSEPPRAPLAAAWGRITSLFRDLHGDRGCHLPRQLQDYSGAWSTPFTVKSWELRKALVTSERSKGGGGEEGERREVSNWVEAAPWIKNGLDAQGIDWNVVRSEPGLYPLEFQACIFSSVGAVVGAHGSNLANIVWMRKGGRVVEVLKPKDVPGPRHSNFWHVATALDLAHFALVSSPGFEISREQAATIANFVAEQ